MLKDIWKYISTYSTYQKMKYKIYLLYNEFVSLSISNRSFYEISLDFVINLLESKTITKKIVDIILIVINWYTKYAIYIFTIIWIINDNLTTLLFQNIFKRFGIPDEIISDRRSLFINKFWATFCYYIAYKWRFNIAYHLQINS